MFFRTLWNGWPTTARMHTAAGAPHTGGCAFGYDGCDDRIEHYLVCRAVWQFLPSIGLGIHRRSKQVMLASERGLTEAELAVIACTIYEIA